MHASFLRILKPVLLASLLLPVVALFCRRFDADIASTELTGGFIAECVGGLLLAIALFAAFLWLLRKAGPAIEATGQLQAEFLDRFNERYVDVAIFAAAAASLFLELAVIRWQGSVFAFFAFYKNLTLLCAFAGLGLGYALAGARAIPLVLTAPVLGYQMLLMIGLRRLLDDSQALASPISEQLNMGYGTATTAGGYVTTYSVIAVVFLMTALAFVPVGQLCGRVMRRRENLRAYGWNLLGSLAGVAGMFAVSDLQTGPLVWFGASLLVILLFQAFKARVLAVGAVFTLAALTVLAVAPSGGWRQIYSPYQLIELGQAANGPLMLRAGGLFHQNLLDLSRERVAADQSAVLKGLANFYDFPYRVLARPAKVAVVGAGTGNDAAAALRNDATAVDAIEIDPVILDIGRACHPERPYSDPRVHTILNDARTFLRNTAETYDMVVYGFLDSHTLLSHASSVRLDSFVYTVEGLKEALARLRDGGILSVSFYVINDELGRKLYLTMRDAFGGRPPICVRARHNGLTIFLQAKGKNLFIPSRLLRDSGMEDCTGLYADGTIRADVSTDDWPFFYMPRRVYPVSYVFMMALIVLLTALLIWGISGTDYEIGCPSTASMGSLFRSLSPKSLAAFFFLGAGFMLVETKGITELGLTFGNTWQVIAVVIAGILSMGFAANCAVRWIRPKRPWIPFALVVLTLAGGYCVSLSGGLPSTCWGRVGTAALLTAPLFASGLVFSTLLRGSGELPAVMAANLMGAMLGGILEYNSMYFGFRFLYLLAIALYLLALVVSISKMPRIPTVAA